MMRSISKNMILPGFVGSGVLVLGLSLLAIVARGPYTHANLNLGFDPRYTRTEQMLVGAPVPFGGDQLAVAPASDPAEFGHQLFVIKGCAGCHGLDGRGGIIGPAIVGKEAHTLRTVTTVGPGGMPAYAPESLSDSDLAAIAAYLNTMLK